jgi:hypothetical protein
MGTGIDKSNIKMKKVLYKHINSGAYWHVNKRNMERIYDFVS